MREQEPINRRDSPEAALLPLLPLAFIAGMLSRAFPEVLSPRNPVSVFQLSGSIQLRALLMKLFEVLTGGNVPLEGRRSPWLWQGQGGSSMVWESLWPAAPWARGEGLRKDLELRNRVRNKRK